MPRRRVVVVGGGPSGALAAIHLLRDCADRPEVVVVDPRARLGGGVAFGDALPEHRVNVPAARMSALADAPGDLVEWLASEGRPEGPADFIPRLAYGRYVQDRLLAAESGAPGRLVVHRDVVADIGPRSGGRRTVRLAGGLSLGADAVVIAIGPPPPAPAEGLLGEIARRGALVTDPWSDEAMWRVAMAGRALILGTGLTMADVAVSATRRSPSLSLLAVSRHGMAPLSHAAVGPCEPIRLEGDEPVALMRSLRARVAATGDPARDWRRIVDGLRDDTPRIWRRLGPEERSRMLRHAMRHWDVHRHRVPPEVGSELDRLRAAGRLRIEAARLVGARPVRGGVEVTLAARGGAPVSRERVGVVVACTGAGRMTDGTLPSVLRGMADRGEVRADALGLGLAVDAAGHPLARDGRAAADVTVIGALRRAECWESTAIPELRAQSAAAAAAAASAADTAATRRSIVA